jgi:lysylphosphatidylglycerol synthetase-like protein (DUF2156 family)
MITFVRNVFLALGLAVSIIGIIDFLPRALIVGLALLAAAYAIQRRSPAFWWVAAAVLVIAFCASLREFFRGPQTPLPFMCSVLSTIAIALISSVWLRQKAQFRKKRLTSE